MNKTQFQLHCAFIEGRDQITRFFQSRVGCVATAEDFAHETYLRAVQSEPKLPLLNPSAYLFRIARNLLMDHFRKQQSQQVDTGCEEAILQLQDTASSPEKRIQHQQELTQLHQAIERLPQRCREVFVLARVEGLSYVQIGEQLGISQKTAFTHMTRALALLKLDMDKKQQTKKHSDNS